MKKLILLVVMVVLASVLNAQQFNGVSVSGPFLSVVEKFKAKGFKVKVLDSYAAIMTGNLQYRPVDLFIMATPKSKMVFKFAVYMNKQNTWDDLLSDYRDYVKVMYDKFGVPDAVQEEFEFPYELGDGYEITAVEAEKCLYTSIWLNKSNVNIMVEISKYKQIKIVYENALMLEQRNLEMEQINSKIF
jgi:hypothetical protein